MSEFMNEELKKIDVPYSVDDDAVFWFEINEEEVVSKFGRWHRESDQGDNDPGPCKYWAYWLPCDTPIVIRCHTNPHGVEILSSKFDEQHLLYHLPTDWTPSWLSPRCAELSRSFQVVRMDDNGNKTVILGHVSEQFAACKAAQMEKSGHKQTFWVEREV